MQVTRLGACAAILLTASCSSEAVDPESVPTFTRSAAIEDGPVSAQLARINDSLAALGLNIAVAKAEFVLAPTAPEPAGGQIVFANVRAKRLDTRHREVELTAADLRASWPRALAAMDQPSIDGFNTFVISRAAHEAGFKVVLSGLGGDELLAGYPSFRELPLLMLAARECDLGQVSYELADLVNRVGDVLSPSAR